MTANGEGSEIGPKALRRFWDNALSFWSGARHWLPWTALRGIPKDIEETMSPGGVTQAAFAAVQSAFYWRVDSLSPARPMVPANPAVTPVVTPSIG